MKKQEFERLYDQTYRIWRSLRQEQQEIWGETDGKMGFIEQVCALTKTNIKDLTESQLKILTDICHIGDFVAYDVDYSPKQDRTYVLRYEYHRGQMTFMKVCGWYQGEPEYELTCMNTNCLEANL